MSLTDPRAVASSIMSCMQFRVDQSDERIVCSIVNCAEIEQTIITALADAERRGYRAALNDVTQDFAENLYGIGIDIGTNEVLAFLESRIVHYPKAQAQADKEAPHGTDAE